MSVDTAVTTSIVKKMNDTMNSNTSEHHKVIIIGAGLSGISAACELLKSDFTDFIILEASDRIGGRVHTVKFGDSVVDFGAEFVEGEEGNIIYEMASPHDLLIPYSRFVQNTIFVNNSGKYEEAKYVLQLINKANSLLYNISTQTSGSLRNYFIPRYNELVTELNVEKTLADRVMESVVTVCNILKGFDTLDIVGTSAMTEYVSLKGVPDNCWKDQGFQRVFDLLTFAFPDSKRELPVKQKILYNKVVSNITYNRVNNVDVSCENGVHYYADHVIVTSSLGFLKTYYSTFFTPGLPIKKQTTIEALGYATVDKIYLLFPYRWWPEEVKSFILLWTNAEKNDYTQNLESGKWVTDITGFYFVENQPRMLCSWVHGNAAKEMEKSSDEVVINSTYNLLKKFLGEHFEIPKPEAMARSSWFSDKYSLGSCSYRTLDSDYKNAWHADLAEPIFDEMGKLRVLFAGEATHPSFFFSTHGAIETGVREAKRVLDYLSLK